MLTKGLWFKWLNLDFSKDIIQDIYTDIYI